MGVMRFALILYGLSVASAQSPSLFSSSRSSPRSSSSSSLSFSPQNVSSAIVSPTTVSSKSITSPSSSSQVVFPSITLSMNISTIASASPTPTVYSNPWAGNFSGNVSAHGTGSAYALQCQNAWFSYTSINSDYISATASTYYYTSTIRSTTVYVVRTLYETSYYTLCDGHPIVITSTPTLTTTTTLLPSTTTILAQGVSFADYPNPNCTVNWDDCQELWSTYSSAKSVYDSISFNLANTVVQMGSGASYWMVNGVTTTFPAPSPEKISLGTEYIHKYYKKGQYMIVTKPPPGGFACDCGQVMTAGGPPVTIQHTVDFTNTPYTPSCRTEKPTCTANQRCQIDGDRVEIYWFPPQTNVTRDMCATAPAEGPITSRPPTNFTWTPITTGPYTVLPGNTTWFSGNVYVSLNRINAECNWSGTSVLVGSTHDGEILTMAPSELFSQRAISTAIGDRSSLVDFEPYAYSFNFNDLISPYPWSAWNGGFDCVKDACTTMNGKYNPWIAVPEAIRRLDPKWATCDLALYGLYDPPIALSSVGNIFASTTKPVEGGPGPTPGPSPPQTLQPTHTPLRPQDPLPWQSESPKPLPPVLDPPSNPGVVPKPGGPDPDPDPSPPRQGLTPAPPFFPQPTTIGTIDKTPIVIVPANPTEIQIGTTKLTPGSPGLTVGAGTTISMRDPGHIIISTPGSAAPSTINIPQPIGKDSPVPTAGVIITLPNGEHITATAVIGEGHSGSRTATSIFFRGTMLSEGGPPITLPNGVVLSEAPGGTGIVVIHPSSGATSTLAFSSMPGIHDPQTTLAPTAIVTIGGKTYTATTQSGSVVIPELGLTLTREGPALTVNGTTISDAGEKTGVVVGTTTATFVTPTKGGWPGSTARTGGAGRVEWERWRGWWGLLVGVVVMGFV